MMKEIRKFWKNKTSQKHIIGALLIVCLFVIVALTPMNYVNIVEAGEGDMDDTVISDYQITATPSLYIYPLQVGDTEYYVTAYAEDDTSNDGYLKTVRIYHSNGSIVETVVDTLMYHSNVRQAGFINITDNLFGIFQRDLENPDIMRTLWVANDGDIAAASNDTLTLSYSATSRGNWQNLVYLEDSSMLVYATQDAPTDIVYVGTVWVNTLTGALPAGENDTIALLSGGDAISRPYDMKIVDSDTVVIAVYNDSHQYIETLNISSNGTITHSNVWDTGIVNVGEGELCKISDTVFGIAFRNGSDSGDAYIGTFGLTADGVFDTWIDGPIEYSATDTTQPAEFFHASGTIYGVLSGKQSGACWVSTFNISSAGDIIGDTEIDSINLIDTMGDGIRFGVCNVADEYFVAGIRVLNGAVNLTTFYITEAEEVETSSFSIKGLTNNRISWEGTAGTAVWCNATGDAYETLEMNLSINSTDNVTELRVFVDDLNNTGEWINASNVSIIFSSDNSSWAGGDGSINTTSFIDGGSNVTINSTLWTEANGFYGASPFTDGGITNTTLSIYCRFKLAIPATASATTFYASSGTAYKIYIGHYV